LKSRVHKSLAKPEVQFDLVSGTNARQASGVARVARTRIKPSFNRVRLAYSCRYGRAATSIRARSAGDFPEMRQ
jgi:hypothetical protein